MNVSSTAIQNPSPFSVSRDGITWLEVLIVLTIFGLLSTLCWPYILSLREMSRVSSCQYNFRQLGNALNSYHDTYQTLPCAAVWTTSQMESLALHRSRRFDVYAQANWALALLPYTEMANLADQFHAESTICDSQNEVIRNISHSSMVCPSDSFNNPENNYTFYPADTLDVGYSFARGNYAINGGSHCFDPFPGSTAFLVGDGASLTMSRDPKEFRYSGNGIAGINTHFSFEDCTNGLSTLVAFDEIRAGIHSIDPRGVWALGQIGGSITWAHGVNGDASGPNNQEPRSDDILNCGDLHELFGAEKLQKLEMPCVHYIDTNFQATSRSTHAGGVNVLMLDGSTRFISNEIAPGLWHVMHSRKTPTEVLEQGLDHEMKKMVEVNSKPVSKQPPPNAVSTNIQEIENSLGMRFLRIPAGCFLMGLPDSGNNHKLPEEAPAHEVTITHDFFLGCYETTQEQYATVMQHNLSFHKGENFPVEQVTWHQAVEFCRRLSQLPEEQSAGRSYRLPTEAEWEYACRGGSKEPYKWSVQRRENDQTGAAAGILPDLPVQSVGQYSPNEFGLYDMRGNVWEWCSDWFRRDYYSVSPSLDPQGPAHGYIKVVRGSDWTFVGEGCKLSTPMMPPWESVRFVGFRVVCESTKPISN